MSSPTDQLQTEIVQDRGPQMIAIFWVEAAIAILVVALRIWGRMLLKQVGADDYVMVFTLVLFLLLASFCTYDASIGGLKHLFDLAPEQQSQVLRINWIAQPWVIFGFATGKLSVGLLILRLIGPNTFWRKWIIYSTTGACLVFNAIDCIVTFTQCSPPKALWEPQLVTEGKAKCWNPHSQEDYAIFISSWNVFVDVVLAVLPVTIFYKLSLSFEKKLGLSILLGLGLLAATCGAIKIKFLAGLSARSDLTWETYNLFVWSGSELFLIIVCGSIPPIKPLYDMTFKKNRTRAGYGYTNSRNNYPTKYSQKSNSSERPLESSDRNFVNLSDEEHGIVGVGAVENRRGLAKSGGIMKITDITIVHGRK